MLDVKNFSGGVRCSLILLLVGSFLSLGCSGGLRTVKSLDVKAAGSSGEDEEPRVDDVLIPPKNPGDLAQLTKVTGNGDLFLADKKIITFDYTVGGGISGPINLSVDRSALSGIVGAQDIKISVRPESLVVTPGMTFSASLEIETPSQAPSFASKNLSVILAGDGGNPVVTMVPMVVSPILEIRMYGCQFRNNAALDDCWNRPGSMDLRAHADDIQLRFYNCDPASGHIVHGNNPIQHGDRNNAMPVAASKENCAGMHLATVEGNSTGSGTYYMHDTQNSGQARRINFGVVNPLVATMASKVDAFDREAEDTGGTCNH